MHAPSTVGILAKGTAAHAKVPMWRWVSNRLRRDSGRNRAERSKQQEEKATAAFAAAGGRFGGEKLRRGSSIQSPATSSDPPINLYSGPQLLSFRVSISLSTDSLLHATVCSARVCASPHRDRSAGHAKNFQRLLAYLICLSLAAKLASFGCRLRRSSARSSARPTRFHLPLARGHHVRYPNGPSSPLS